MMIYKSDYSITDISEKLGSLKDSNKTIVIFGTGNYGTLALHALKKNGITIDYFCDNNKANWGTLFCGYPVISPEQLSAQFSDAVVIIASLRFKYMANQLKNCPNIHLLNCDFLFAEIDLSDIDASAPIERLIWMLDLYMFAIDSSKNREKIKIKSLDIVVTEKCSLRCRDCSNLMQYYQKPRDADRDILLASIDRFMTNVDELLEARILGGEPFMYKDLPAIIEKLSSYGNCRKITILTNGTLLPRDRVLESLKNSKVSLIISDYGKLSKNITGLKTILGQNKIPFIANNIDSWQDCATIAFRERTDNELMNLFGDCCVNDTLTLLHGRLYTCPFSAHTDNLKGIPVDQNEDQIDLIRSNDQQIKEKIRNLYSGKKYLKACSYCAGRDYNAGRIEVAAQASSPIKLKIHENDAA